MRLREVRATYGPVAGVPPGPRPQIRSGRDAAPLLSALLLDQVGERFGVLSVDTKHRIIGWDIVSVGSLDATMIHPRDVFRTAILQNAAAIIVCHNHPSGETTPSADDEAITVRLREGGTLLGINVLDHIIVGGDAGGYWSFQEQGRLT
jgi:DNA repair protein RadC